MCGVAFDGAKVQRSCLPCIRHIHTLAKNIHTFVLNSLTMAEQLHHESGVWAAFFLRMPPIPLHLKMLSHNMSKVLIALLFAQTLLPAQTPAAPETSDPQAKKVLDKIRKKYDAYKTVELAFSLTIEVPGEDKEVRKGTITQEGQKFRLDMSDQIIISDAVTTWVYEKKANEVQINNADPNDANSLLSPKDLLNRYQKGDYLYAITDKTTEGNKVLTQIEFKPKDRNSEYAKLRLSIDETSGTIQNLKAFAKDGSRYTFSITKLSPNITLPVNMFSFDKNAFKGVRVEDLRM